MRGAPPRSEASHAGCLCTPLRLGKAPPSHGYALGCAAEINTLAPPAAQTDVTALRVEFSWGVVFSANSTINYRPVGSTFFLR